MILPSLTFSGECSKAIEFYEKVFQCKRKMCQLYGDYIPEGLSNIPTNLSEWILHAEMEVAGTTIWFADEILNPVNNGNNINLIITVPTKTEASMIFNNLLEDGNILLPPTDTFYSTFHAGVIDKYGNSWNIIAEEAPSLQ